jgi:serine kinase of HPr protein (carbohydrate metabolism regulator)
VAEIEKIHSLITDDAIALEAQEALLARSVDVLIAKKDM